MMNDVFVVLGACIVSFWAFYRGVLFADKRGYPAWACVLCGVIAWVLADLLMSALGLHLPSSGEDYGD